MRNSLKKLSVLGVVALGLGLSSGSFAADGATLYKTKTCVACHGPDGKKPILPTYPKLNGQNEAYLTNQMKDIKSGARNNGQTAAMKGVMHLVSDAEITTIAKWLAGIQ